MSYKPFEDKLNKMLTEETPDVLDNIKNNPRFQVHKKEKSFNFIRKPRLSFAFSSIFILGLLVFTILLSQGQSENNVIASTVTIDINPSIELSLNNDNEVIDIQAINEDAIPFLNDNDNFKGLSLEKAIEVIVQRAIDRGFIFSDNNSFLVNVIANNESKRALIRTKIEEAFVNEEERHNRQFMIRDMLLNSSIEDQETARDLHMSVAKYELIQSIIAASDTYTIEDLQSESIRNLFALLQDLDGDESQFPPMGPRDDMPGHR